MQAIIPFIALTILTIGLIAVVLGLVEFIAMLGESVESLPPRSTALAEASPDPHPNPQSRRRVPRQELTLSILNRIEVFIVAWTASSHAEGPGVRSAGERCASATIYRAIVRRPEPNDCSCEQKKRSDNESHPLHRCFPG